MRPNLKILDLKEGEVYYPRFNKMRAKHKYRKIVKITNEKVFYCSGGNDIYSCRINTFLYNCTAWKPDD
jgi:hypothetical protein